MTSEMVMEELPNAFTANEWSDYLNCEMQSSQSSSDGLQMEEESQRLGFGANFQSRADSMMFSQSSVEPSFDLNILNLKKDQNGSSHKTPFQKHNNSRGCQNLEDFLLFKKSGSDGSSSSSSSFNRSCSSSKGHERFIPSRKFSKMHIAFESKDNNNISSQQTKEDKQDKEGGGDENTMSIAELYQKHVLATSDNSKILCFEVKKKGSNSMIGMINMEQEDQLYDENFFRCDQKSGMQDKSIVAGSGMGNSILPKKKKAKQMIFTESTKILDAPGLEDDYYLNLLHWSAQNIISIVLKNEVFGYNYSTKKIFSLQKPDKFNTYKFTSVKFSKSGKLLAIGDSLGGVQVIDAETRSEIAFFQNHEERVGSLAWIDDDILASGSKDRNIYCHDIRDKAIVRKYMGHRNEVCGLEWSPDQQSLASGGNDDKLFVWNIAYNNHMYKFNQHKAAVKAIAWNPHQHGLLASGGGSRDKTIRFWNIHTGKEVDCIQTNSQVCSLAFSQNVNQFVSTHGFADNEIYVWKYPQPQKIKVFQGHSQRVIYMALSPDQKSIVTGASDETLRFWDAFPDKPIFKSPESTLKFLDLR